MTFKNTCAILLSLLLTPLAWAQPTRPLADVLLDLGSATTRLAVRIAAQQAKEQWRMDRGPLYKSTPAKENGDPNVVTDDLFFEGTFLPASDKSTLAIFSDDGCDVWIDDKLVMNNFKKGQHLPALNQSFRVVNGANGKPFPFRKGTSYQIKIRYSNTVFNGKTDIDGLTVFAYNGGGDSVRVSLLVDTNRDGVVKESDDEAGKDAYTQTRGALFIPNYDRDRGNVHAAARRDDVPAGENAPDVLDFGPDGTPYPASETKTIKNASDAADIAPLVIRPLEGPLPTGAKVFLTLADVDEAKAIHVYKKIAPGETSFWGGLAETKTEKDITAMVSLTSDTTFGVEGLFFRNTGDVNKFKGEVNFTLELRVPDKGGTLVTTSSDKVKLTVAPYMLLPNTLDASKVWMTTDAGANEIAAAFGPLSQRRVPSTGSQWFQDHVQIGYTSFPNPANKQMRLTLQMPYPPQQDLWPRRNLLEKGEGLYRFRNTARLDRTGYGPSGTYGGNLEVIPPTKDWPLGRIIVGSTMIRPEFSTSLPETRLYDFLTSQRVQKPFSVNVHWLLVGHVDEVMNIVPGGGANGFRIGRASPRYARELLDKGDKTRGVAAPADYVSIFATGAEDHGQASNAITTTGKIWLFDGVAHGRVQCVAKADIKDGETVAISDGAQKLTFEFDTDGKVAKGNVAVDISGSTTAGDVRDQLRAVLNGAGYNVTSFDDDADSLVLINKDFGKAGNKTITTTVKNAGFKVQGMKGGKAAADGKDFTKKDWKFVRIHNATGAGQVAALNPRFDLHKGWLTVNNAGVFYTTSRIVVDTSVSPSPKSLELFLETRDPVPSGYLWETEPDSTSEYLLAEDCQIWDHTCIVGGARIQQAVPALYSVGEMKRESTLWKLNQAADDEAIAARDAIRINMGAGAIPKEDFLRLPVIFLGHWDGTRIVERTGLAFVPGGQNFQPASPGTIVFAKQFGPRQAGVDIFQKVIRDKVAGAKFANDWSLYHILEGEVHCGTEVTRAFPAFSWWQRQPAP